MLFFSNSTILPYLHIGLSLEAEPVEVLRSRVPNDVRRGPGAGGRPVLHLGHLSPAAVAAVLVLPLPVHAANDARPGKYAANRELLGLSSRFLERSNEVKNLLFC